MSIDDYVKEPIEIGHGSFGTVYRAREKKGLRRQVAIKVVDVVGADAEIHILESTQHNHIIRYYTSFRVDAVMWIVLEYATAGTLQAHVMEESYGRPCEMAMLAFIGQIASALSYLHGKHIMHRDLKPQNILGLREKTGKAVTWKLADFGLAKELTQDERHRYMTDTCVGTPCYMAPEVLRGVTGYSFSADVWSLGATASFVCTKRHLFHGGVPDVLGWVAGMQALPPDTYSVELRDLFGKMLNPTTPRLEAAEVLDKCISIGKNTVRN